MCSTRRWLLLLLAQGSPATSASPQARKGATCNVILSESSRSQHCDLTETSQWRSKNETILLDRRPPAAPTASGGLQLHGCDPEIAFRACAGSDKLSSRQGAR
eukprot:765947-Hanusia_phi.AAC.2